MIKIGIVGTSEGNGHPYSYSAIFNGYNEKNLYQDCPFYLIKDYLPKYHKNKNSIKGAKVSHIWTQNKNESKRIAGVSNIPNISNSLDDLIKNVDAIILARDDPQNHFNILKKIAESKKTFFVDKQIVHSKKNLNKFQKIISPNQKFMACSAIKYSKAIKEFNKNFTNNKVMKINGKSKSTWLLYGHHLLDGIFEIVKNNVLTVSNKFSNNIETISINCEKNININLKFSSNFDLPIYFNVETNSNKNQFLFDDYFYIYKQMLKDFVKLIISEENYIDYNHIYKLNKIVLAGEISRLNNGSKIKFAEI